MKLPEGYLGVPCRCHELCTRAFCKQFCGRNPSVQELRPPRVRGVAFNRVRGINWAVVVAQALPGGRRSFFEQSDRVRQESFSLLAQNSARYIAQLLGSLVPSCTRFPASSISLPNPCNSEGSTGDV